MSKRDRKLRSNPNSQIPSINLLKFILTTPSINLLKFILTTPSINFLKFILHVCVYITLESQIPKICIKNKNHRDLDIHRAGSGSFCDTCFRRTNGERVYRCGMLYLFTLYSPKTIFPTHSKTISEMRCVYMFHVLS